MVAGWETQAGDFPRAPANVHVASSFQVGSYDIHWDNPALQWANGNFAVVGVNIYRSDVSERGPYFRVNAFPLGSTFYRDQTQYVLIQDEVVTQDRWAYQGQGPNDRRFVFHTQFPIAKIPENLGAIQMPYGPYQTPVNSHSPKDVIVKIDGETVIVDEVFGRTGQVTLINVPTIDPATEKCVEAVLPGPNSVTQVTYYTARNFIQSGLESKVHWRLTTVVQDATAPGGLLETPLAWSEPHSNLEVETISYKWREAMRRNNWILEQGGERVRAFIRRQNGFPCNCPEVHPRSLEYSKQPSNRCLTCFGTGFIGGYEGPFDIIVAPDDAERRVAQTPTGRRLEHTYEVWTGASPLLTQRDFIVKQTNERYSIGPVRRPSSRGNVMQQHFSIAYLDEQDIRYKLCLDDPLALPWPETRGANVPPTAYPGRQPHPGYIAWQDKDGVQDPPYPPGPTAVNPMATEKSNIPDDRELRGRTKVWENIEY